MAQDKKTPRKSPKYKDWMADELLKLADTHFFVDIAVKWGISRKTLHRWSNDPTKPEFVLAWQLAKDKIHKRYMDMGLDNIMDRNFNSRMWEHMARVIMMEEYKMAVALPGFADAGPKERIKIIFKVAERGELKTSEIKDLLDAIKSANEIEKLCEMEERLNALEKRMTR